MRRENSIKVRLTEEERLNLGELARHYDKSIAEVLRWLASSHHTSLLMAGALPAQTSLDHSEFGKKKAAEL